MANFTPISQLPAGLGYKAPTVEEFMKQVEKEKKIKQAPKTSLVLETAKQFPSAFKETVEEFKWLPKKIRKPAKKLSEFLFPRDLTQEERLVEMALGASAGLKRVGAKAVTKGLQKLTQKLQPLAKEAKIIDNQIHYNIRKSSQTEIDSVINKLKVGNTIKVYRAGEEGIVAGSRVSPFKNIAEDFTHRGKITSKEVRISDLLVEKDSGHLIYKASKDWQPDFFIQAVKGVAPKTIERKFITSVKEKIPALETKIGGQYIPRSTDKLVREAQVLIKTDLVAAEKLIAGRANDKSVATAIELIKRNNELAQKSTSKLVKDVHYDKASKVANEMAEKLTEGGRTIQAAATLGQLTPEGQLRFAARTIQRYNEGVKVSKQIPRLTAEQTRSILEQMNQIHQMPDGVGKAMSFKKVQNEIQDLVPTPLFKKIINIWKAGLLTGIKTSGLNTFSNFWHGVSEVVKDVPAVLVDKVASLFTGKRTIGLTAMGTLKGISEGFSKGVRYLRTGFDERNIAPKLDWKRVNFGDSKFAKSLQTYEQTIFRLMGAEDQPFYYGAKARSLGSQAIAQGKNQGLKGKKLTNFVNKSIKSPTDEMLNYAAMDAEIAVFQNKTALGTVAKGLQELGKGAGQIVVPFGRTPAAVATQMFNYTPAGIVSAVIKSIGRGKFDQRLFSQAIGRGVTGTGILAIGGALFNKGLISLEYPTSEKEQKQWQLEGKKSNAIKIGNKWRSVSTLGPAGMVLLIGGHFQNGLKETGTIFGGITQAMAGGVKSLTEQTFLQGLNQAVAALNDPNRLESYVKRTVGSVIPTIVSDVARAVDPVERRVEGFLDSLITRIPGARKTLEPRIDVLGQELERGGNFLETMIDPTRPVEIKTSPVIDEMKRLWDLGYRVTPTQLGNKEGYAVLTPENNTRLWQKTGQLLERKLDALFTLESYQRLSDEGKSKKIDEFVTKSNLYGRVETVMQETEGLTGQTLREKLSELKADGLLTRTVFNKYNELR